MNSRLIKIGKFKISQNWTQWKNLNQTCCQSVPTADRRHWENELSPLIRHRSATQLSRENLRLNDFGRSLAILVDCHGNIITIIKLWILFLEFG